MPDIVCPKCKSADVIFSKKRQLYVCEEPECKHEFLPEKVRPHLRIFISYGRDEYSSLAERLKQDLEARGHRAWFDKERLKEGGDWERYIDEGLNEVAKDITTGRVVFIMTPHSTRRPDGYCLNELARALSRSLPVVPVMLVYSEPPLSICRLQYLDMQDSYPPDKNAVTYEQRFERLVAALEENRLDFEGFQGRLLAALDPIKFHADIQKLLRDFTGRKWVIEEVDKWYQDPNGSKIFWLTGAPGTGKSAVAAWIRDNRREIAAYHFCDINSEEKRNASKLVRSISYQLSTQLPYYEEKLKSLPIQEFANEYKEAYTLFDKLIVQPLTENFPDPGRAVVVLIDALDEATYKGNNEIVLFLSRCADKTPTWLRFLVTSRPEQEITSSLQTLSPYLLNTDTEANRNDISEYLKNQLPDITAEQTDRILERSEGIFLYVKHVCNEIKGKRLSLYRIDEFPKGLGDVYKQFFENRIPADRLDYYRQEIRPLLCAVLASFEPLTLGHLMRLLGKKNLMELFDVTDTLGSLFPRTGDSESGTISPFHRSIKDWITVKASAGAYHIDEKYGYQILAEDGWNQHKMNVEKVDSYSLVWLPMHLDEVGAYEKLIIVLKDFKYIMARVKAGYLERMLEDYRETVKNLPPDLQKQLRIEEAFFREKAHILRRGNEEWPAYKILLQLAMEHADDSPVTKGAEGFLAEKKCEWVWLRRERRTVHAVVDNEIPKLERHLAEVISVLRLAGGHIVSSSADKTLRLWDSNGVQLAVLEGHTAFVNGALDLNSGHILSWSVDQTLRMWDSNGVRLAVFEGHSGPVKGALELNDGRIISWSVDKTLRLWDSNGAILAVFAGHTDAVKGALELTDGNILSWSVDETLRMWDSNGVRLLVLEGHTASVKGALELTDGRILSWSVDQTLRLWENNGNSLEKIQKNSEINGALELSAGRILSWTTDNTLLIWELDSTEPGITMKGQPESSVSAVKYYDDQRILAWSEDCILKHDVFISYSAKDKHLAEVICNLLEADNITVWITPRNIRPGSEWADEVVNAIGQSRLVVLIFSAHANESPICKREILLAANLGKPIIPIRTETMKLNSWWKMVIGAQQINVDSSEAIAGWVERLKGHIRKTINNQRINAVAMKTLKVPHRAEDLNALKLLKEKKVILWHGTDICHTYVIEREGHAIVAQGDGQVCFLKLYDGNRRITLDELETKFATQG